MEATIWSVTQGMFSQFYSKTQWLRKIGKHVIDSATLIKNNLKPILEKEWE